MKSFFKTFTLVVVAASLYSCGNHDQAQNQPAEEKIETTSAPETKPDSASAAATPVDSNAASKEASPAK